MKEGSQSPGRSGPVLRAPGARALYRAYYGSRFRWPLWRHVLNREGLDLYRRLPPAAGEGHRSAIEQLTSHGIAVTRFERLVEGGPDFAQVRAAAESVLALPETQTRIRDTEREGSGARKHYLLTLWDLTPPDVKQLMVDLFIREDMLAVAAGYLGTCARLMYMDLWYNVPMPGPAILSQRWHRDPEDRRIVKCFLYLRDVSAEAGPFCYVPDTHDLGRHRRAFARKPPFGSHPPDEAVEARFSKDQMSICTGDAGTFVICDTSGVHKGGHASGKPRFLLHAMYTTNAALPMARKSRNVRYGDAGNDELAPTAEYALR